MLRGLVFFLKLAVLVAGAVWIAEQPGSVLIEWQGYRIETTVGILLLVLLVVAGIAAVLWRFWGRLVRMPRNFAAGWRNRRRQRGYKALTQGMVSVAAGEPDEAARFARRADSLLDEPPLTMLLSAQAAQLNGDETAARRYFEAMLENPETRFLGLRGLLRQAEREGDLDAALSYAREAREIRPQTPWVLNSVFAISLRRGDLDEALDAVEQLRRHKLLSREEANRRRAVMLTEEARKALAEEREAFARDYSKEAHRLAPDLVAAALVRAQVLTEDGYGRSAARAIERSWSLHPHPDLVEAYLRARPANDAIGRYNRIRRLVERTPEHREASLALGRAALEAKLWGEARRHLTAAGGENPSEAICRLLAELEEQENDDRDAARTWLRRATEAPADPAWTCGACGAVAGDWHAICSHCDAFDSFAWQTPPRVAEALGPPSRTLAVLEPDLDRETAEAADEGVAETGEAEAAGSDTLEAARRAAPGRDSGGDSEAAAAPEELATGSRDGADRQDEEEAERGPGRERQEDSVEATRRQRS